MREHGEMRSNQKAKDQPRRLMERMELGGGVSNGWVGGQQDW